MRLGGRLGMDGVEFAEAPGCVCVGCGGGIGGGYCGIPAGGGGYGGIPGLP